MEKNTLKRAKCEDTFSGPHRVLGKVGKFSYQVTSHVLTAKTLLVNLNDIKILHIPDCKNWKLNSALIPGLLSELNSKETLCEPMIDYNSIGALVNDLMTSKQKSLLNFLLSRTGLVLIGINLYMNTLWQKLFDFQIKKILLLYIHPLIRILWENLLGVIGFLNCVELYIN